MANQETVSIAQGVSSAAGAVAVTMGWNPVGWIAGFIAIVAAVIAASEQKRINQQKRNRANATYYQQVQSQKIGSNIQKNATSSAKTIREQASRATDISEQMIKEASTREANSRKSPQSNNKSGFRPRDLKQRQKDFGNAHASLRTSDEEMPATLLDQQSFGETPEFLKTTNFGVENFNNKLIEN